MSYAFSGTSHRLIGNTTPAPFTGSLSLWYKPNWAASSGGPHQWYRQEKISSGHDFGIIQLSAIIQGGWNATGDQRTLVAAADFPHSVGNWNHLALTWDDTTNLTTLYLNNAVPTGTNPFTSLGPETFDSAKSIGNALAIDGSFNFDGKIAEVALYTVALTAGQITSLQTLAPNHASLPTPLSYWPLRVDGSPGAGQTPDLMAAADHLTVSGAVIDADNPLVSSAPVVPGTWDAMTGHSMGFRTEYVGY